MNGNESSFLQLCCIKYQNMKVLFAVILFYCLVVFFPQEPKRRVWAGKLSLR